MLSTKMTTWMVCQISIWTVQAMGKERAEWVAVKGARPLTLVSMRLIWTPDPLSSNGASDEAPPGSPFARPADAEPDTQDLDPSVVAARLRARRARENAEDTRRDVADLRGVMRKAMEVSSFGNDYEMHDRSAFPDPAPRFLTTRR